MMVIATSTLYHRLTVWDWFYFYQLLETFSACVLVTLMRHHDLMLWAILPMPCLCCNFVGVRYVEAREWELIIWACQV